MALDLTGIENRGEFYSHHYLDALLEGDLKPLLKKWEEAEQGTPPRRAPWKALNALAGRYFQARARAADLGEHAPGESLAAARPIHAELLEALGYQRTPGAVTLDDGRSLPLAHEERRGGRATLWVLEAGFPAEDDGDPMEQVPLASQLPDEAQAPPEESWRELLDRAVFRQEDAPTWVLFLGGREVVLTHRHKWGQGRALAFDLDDLFARRQEKAFRAIAGLLHAEALCPTDGTSLHERLDESSHKHAFAVSTDLREGAQQAIEILGNEAVYYLRNVRKKGAFGGSETAEQVEARQLTRECLTWLYRLIFLFYVESRSDALGVAPMKSEAYRRGYSLESLRALATVKLTTPQAQEGTYLDASLRRLFRLLNDGHPVDGQVALEAGVDTAAFRILGLKSRLFDDQYTPTLAKVRFRNVALQQVIELLSLSRQGKHRQRGQISYATLGINQLGAVYEGLLAYTGFFAEEDLIEVANAGESDKPDARTYFVPARDRDLYREKEIVRGSDGARVQHPKGTYLFRLAGRDREKSASFYTPEVLTRCLVKYTLRERIGASSEDGGWVAADKLLELLICEPAMGSGAFLNEAVNQLAAAYLERKQAELPENADPEAGPLNPIPADRYARELQRVKARVAAQQCYGVDLNPLAAELGRVSLWLNVLRSGAPAPFFDPRLAVGNSLVGARRAGYATRLLKKSRKDKPGWLDLPPEDIGRERPAESIYHFLVPAAGMAAFDGDRVVEGLLPEEVGQIREWRRGLKADWLPVEVESLRVLSRLVDRRWAERSMSRQAALDACAQDWSVWPEEERSQGAREAEDRLARTWRQFGDLDAGGRQLKAVMDYWCALWFWPVREAGLLPERGEWLADLRVLLEGSGEAPAGEERQARRLQVAAEVAERMAFFHWGWSFPEVLERGGFDVVLGNPPWIRVEFKETGILSDLDPRLGIRRMSAKQAADARAKTLAEESAKADYLEEFEGQLGTREFTGSDVMYPLLKGSKANLYRSFICLSWTILQQTGCGGLFHQAGIFDDPKGGLFRRHLYPRLRFAALAKNQLSLFDGVTHQRPFCFTIWTGNEGKVNFRYISNLFHPSTLDESMAHDGLGEVPAIKTPDGDWDLRGHRSRVVEVDEKALTLFAKLYDPPGTPAIQARLPIVHSREILRALQTFSSCDSRLGDLPGDHKLIPKYIDESACSKSGVIIKDTSKGKSPNSIVFTGPILYVATPYYKEANPGCKHNQDFTPIDHQTIENNFIPRTVYSPGTQDRFNKHLINWNGKRVNDYYSHIHRQFIASNSERTLAPAISPRGASCIHTVFCALFENSGALTLFSGLLSSLPYDFFAKTTGKSGFGIAEVSALPIPRNKNVACICVRTLRLNCLTNHYTALWQELYTPAFNSDRFTLDDPRLDDWTHLGPEWTWETPLRSPFARRQALVELDALAALALGLSADELCLIYRVQFPVLQQYEADTWYDRRGRIVFTNNRGLTGVGLSRKEWDEIKDAGAGDALPEWAVDALGPYQPPFDRCDREVDMRRAYAEFQRRGEGVGGGG